MRISDWSSDVCSSDLLGKRRALEPVDLRLERALLQPGAFIFLADRLLDPRRDRLDLPVDLVDLRLQLLHRRICLEMLGAFLAQRRGRLRRSEEHTSELQSLMRISYAVFCLKKNKNQ